MNAFDPKLVRQRALELSLSQARAVTRLINRAFPDPAVSLDERVEHFLVLRQNCPIEMLTVWDGDVPVASASIFPREVATGKGSLALMALAAVCTDPDRRSQGWGRMVVQAAWAEVNGGRFPVALFQTSVPEFYVKLGARKVDNPFVNTGQPDPRPGRGTRERPWWNPHIMIYPAGYAWPTGMIDLCGPGF